MSNQTGKVFNNRKVLIGHWVKIVKYRPKNKLPRGWPIVNQHCWMGYRPRINEIIIIIITITPTGATWASPYTYLSRCKFRVTYGLKMQLSKGVVRLLLPPPQFKSFYCSFVNFQNSYSLFISFNIFKAVLWNVLDMTALCNKKNRLLHQHDRRLEIPHKFLITQQARSPSRKATHFVIRTTRIASFHFILIFVGVMLESTVINFSAEKHLFLLINKQTAICSQI